MSTQQGAVLGAFVLVHGHFMFILLIRHSHFERGVFFKLLM